MESAIDDEVRVKSKEIINTHWCVKDLIITNRRAQVPADVEGQVLIT